MTIQRFIEAAIEGGWDGNKVHAFGAIEWRQLVLLDPLAWKAVGKVEGWEGTSSLYPSVVFDDQMYIVKMHRMIDSLAEGKTIDEFISTL